ncbi:hypothetical protein [Streptomyces fuscigenes]|uniref:hypothetical protein n=1 Tax=Streptomyces fuscigenes TaxID=1528880 RepID=UPI001F23B155|nr:hypothetical protein [Streptomyces fuscigenes]MCF3960590.1 hypothetical protein [Streptomyces fuscigenes]
MLPPAPPGVVPYITQRSEERLLPYQLIRRPVWPGIAYPDETPYDRDSFGTLWLRARLLPKSRRGEPDLRRVHAYRQRRAMLDMLCQVCARPPADPDGPQLFLMRSTGGPIRDGERTTSPPVCVPCAAITVQQCHALRGDQFVAAWVRHTPAWGVAGTVHDPVTLEPIPGRSMEAVEYRAPDSFYVLAARTVVELQGVVAADLEREWAAMGADRLEAEFARVAASMQLVA